MLCASDSLSSVRWTSASIRVAPEPLPVRRYRDPRQRAGEQWRVVAQPYPSRVAPASWYPQREPTCIRPANLHISWVARSPEAPARTGGASAHGQLELLAAEAHAHGLEHDLSGPRLHLARE